ncbi:MAG: Bax inhibitor-1/YccA family protein, partial [Rhizobacter sp.]|nr:Bax inhibitor-1/YccA family protein [Rhizobacter sp.]
MNDNLQTAYGLTGSVSTVDQRNRVLRNTYWLLALSMIPTVLGSWVGMQMGFSWFAANPFIGFMVFMGVAFGFFYAIEKTKNSSLGVVLLLAFTFFMGLMLSRLLGGILGNFRNGSQLIAMAFGGTALVFFGMATLASTMKRDISGMGKWLFVGLIGIIVASVANIWLQMPALMMTVSVLAVLIFSAYMLYDLKRVVDGGETNYVTATLAIYLDVYNVFVHLLSLLG